MNLSSATLATANCSNNFSRLYVWHQNSESMIQQIRETMNSSFGENYMKIPPTLGSCLSIYPQVSADAN